MKELTLPWPSRCLHPNARVHWTTRARAAKEARASACALALIAGWRKAKLPDGRLHLWLTFYPPNRHKHDDDGCLSAFKPWRDGLADALRIDDCRFVSHPFVADEVRSGGEVVVRITSGPIAMQEMA